MIIVSQDKTKIVNFDNLIQIYITQDEEETANTYNEYILKNSFVFEGNIPTDIETRLMIID